MFGVDLMVAEKCVKEQTHQKYDSCKLFRFKAIAKTFTNQMGTLNNDLRAKIAAV